MSICGYNQLCLHNDGIHNLFAHVKNPGAQVFASWGHVLLLCGCDEPGHRHSPFCDIVMPSGQRQEYAFFGAPTHMYEQFDFSQELLPT